MFLWLRSVAVCVTLSHQIYRFIRLKIAVARLCTDQNHDSDVLVTSFRARTDQGAELQKQAPANKSSVPALF